MENTSATPKKKKSPFRKITQFLSSRVVYSFLSLLVIVVGSYFAIQYARGNWRITKEGVVSNTGLLNANSFPDGAQVYIDDKLITATDDTVYLDPGIYQVKILKEGYSPWQKELTIQKELVTQTNATLFPSAPSLTPLTFTGIKNLSPSPDGLKLVFLVDAGSSEAKNGFYVMDLGTNFLSLQSGPRQITDAPSSLALSDAEIIWSPDSTELMILTPEKELLIGVDKKVSLAEQTDIRFQKKQILAGWEEDMYQRERQYLEKFPPEVLEIATESAKNVYISPDKKRLLYTATAAVTLPEDILPPIPATNTQPEERSLQVGAIYVYDREEDKNFRVATSSALPQLFLTEATASATLKKNAVAEVLELEKQLLADDFGSPARTLESSPSAFYRLQKTSNEETALSFSSYYTGVNLNTLQWFPDSKHLLFVQDGKIQIMEYDGYNNTNVYSGPFSQSFVYPWPDGSKLLIMTSFSPDSPDNLYVINLK
jgi:hypothetical protein